MICCVFQIRLNGHVLRAMFICLILNVFFLVIDRAIAQTLTSGLKINSTQELFDPNGYYFPEGTDIVVGGWKIEWIDIQALENHLRVVLAARQAHIYDHQLLDACVYCLHIGLRHQITQK